MKLWQQIAAILVLNVAAAAAEPVSIPAGTVTLTADLALPTGAGPHPAVIALHGCNGMRARDGQRLNARHHDCCWLRGADAR
jgi:poly(3-hydroxybutyrate) depolymerase